MKGRAPIATPRATRRVFPDMAFRKDGTMRKVSLEVTTPAKPTIKVTEMTSTLKSVHNDLTKIQTVILNLMKKDMETVDSYKKQRPLHSVDFYWWVLGSYTTTQACLLNLLAELKALTMLCMELEKLVVDGVPVSIQVEVPKQVEKELRVWLSEREAAKKAQSEYVR